MNLVLPSFTENASESNFALEETNWLRTKLIDDVNMIVEIQICQCSPLCFKLYSIFVDVLVRCIS